MIQIEGATGISRERETKSDRDIEGERERLKERKKGRQRGFRDGRRLQRDWKREG